MLEKAQEYQEAKRMLETLVALNQMLVRENYRRMALKVHHQKKIKLIDPHDPQFFYLN